MCDSIASHRTSVFGNAPTQLHVVLATGFASNTTGWNTTTCQLYNATYTVNTSFPDGEQIITSTVDQFVPVRPVIENFSSEIPDLSGQETNSIFNYLAMMALVGQITVGTLNSAPGVTRLSYEEGSAINVASSSLPYIFMTGLTKSPEFKAMHKRLGTISDISGVEDSAFEGPTTAPLAQLLEELFRNLTVAMSTNPSTSTNESVPGLINFPINRYHYNSEQLWISYALGIGLTALIVLLGYLAVASNGRSYSNKFSTFLRTTPWHVAERSLLENSHTRGADPVPSTIKRLTLSLGKAETTGIESEILLHERTKSTSMPAVDGVHGPIDSIGYAGISRAS